MRHISRHFQQVPQHLGKADRINVQQRQILCQVLLHAAPTVQLFELHHCISNQDGELDPITVEYEDTGFDACEV